MNPASPQQQIVACSTDPGIQARVWQVPNPNARIVFVHGIISHGGWYTASCDYLSSRGIEVHFPDRRGSGINPQSSGDIDCWETWLKDLEGYLETLPRDVPVLVGGISWGGKLAAAVAKRRPELMDAMALICPGLYAYQFPSRMKYRLLGVASKLGLGRVRVPIPLRDATLFTDVPRWQDFICRDPLTLRKVTVRFALADRTLTQFARESPDQIRVPTLLVSAGKDRIVNNSQTQAWFDKINSDAKASLKYEEAAHTFEFEPDPTGYFHDLESWIRKIT